MSKIQSKRQMIIIKNFSTILNLILLVTLFLFYYVYFNPYVYHLLVIVIFIILIVLTPIYKMNLESSLSLEKSLLTSATFVRTGFDYIIATRVMIVFGVFATELNYSDTKESSFVLYFIADYAFCLITTLLFIFAISRFDTEKSSSIFLVDSYIDKNKNTYVFFSLVASLIIISLVDFYSSYEILKAIFIMIIIIDIFMMVYFFKQFRSNIHNKIERKDLKSLLDKKLVEKYNDDYFRISLCLTMTIIFLVSILTVGIN